MKSSRKMNLSINGLNVQVLQVKKEVGLIATPLSVKMVK
jgi:hypothetical protein